MKIVVPYTHLRPEVVQAMADTGRRFTTVYVGTHDSAYWNLLSDLWAAGETFTIVEHDVLVTDRALSALDACPEVWCAHPVRYLDDVYSGLGCTRFRAELIAQAPGAVERIARKSDRLHPPKHWCRLDWWLQCELREQTRFGAHVHNGGAPLGHVRDHLGLAGRIAPTHGCV